MKRLLLAGLIAVAVHEAWVFGYEAGMRKAPAFEGEGVRHLIRIKELARSLVWYLDHPSEMHNTGYRAVLLQLREEFA